MKNPWKKLLFINLGKLYHSRKKKLNMLPRLKSQEQEAAELQSDQEGTESPSGKPAYLQEQGQMVKSGKWCC